MSVIYTGRDRLRRRLTSLYSDTKKSYETATATSKSTSTEDPDLKALHRDYQTQKDRLLAWGVQWSDSKAATSNEVEIDQKIDKAGLGQQVVTVMSEIQNLLAEAEKIQNPRVNYSDKKPSGVADLTSDEITQSRTLLSKLTQSIDTLYTLSTTKQTAGSPPPNKGPVWISKAPLPPSESGGDATVSDLSTNPIEEIILKDPLFIPSSSISVPPERVMASETPPPYEEITPVQNTRVVGLLDTSTLKSGRKAAFRKAGGRPTAAVIEYFPNRVEGSDNIHRTVKWYVARLYKRYHSRSGPNHGISRFLGYTVEPSRARYGMIYEMPGSNTNHTPENLLPRASSLQSIIPSKRDDADPPSPNLEDRYRLSFNIILSLLQLAKMGFNHHDLNSSNIVLFMHPKEEDRARLRTGLRNPYLLPRPAFAQQAQHEPMFISIYRHAKDRLVEDDARPWALAIYSLGLILLEIGLWTPVKRFWKPKYDKPTFTSRLKTIYVPKLASRCGAVFMNVVKLCMAAPENLGPDTRDRRSASEYLLRIGSELARCCAIDLGGSHCNTDLQIYAGALHPHLGTSLQMDYNPPQGTYYPEDSAVGSSMGDAASVKDFHIPTPLPVTREAPQTLKKWNNVDIPQENLDQWNSLLMPRISKLLQKALSSSRESCSASLMMVGSSPETAKTTICIQCTSVDKVRKSLRDGFKCKVGWGLVILKGEVRRSGKSRKGKARKGDARGKTPEAPKSAYQERPSFGASVGAFRDQEHLPPVSFGGVIMVDGEHFGMTVHHMLDAPSDDEDEDEAHGDGQRCSAPRPSSWVQRTSSTEAGNFDACAGSDDDDDDTNLDVSDSESECSTIRPDYIDIESGNGAFFWFSDEFEEAPELDNDESDSGSDDSSDPNEEDDWSEGDVCGIDLGEGEEIYVTQPALDDVEEDVFPCLEDRDEDHLDSHSLGYIHASSGIRRVVAADVKHEIDWALIRINDDRLSGRNDISHGPSKTKKSKNRRKSGVEPSKIPVAKQISSVAPCSSLARLHVQSHGRTSGLQSGRISAAPALVRLHGRQSFSSSWVVEGGGFGIPGDSGAWIYEAESGQLCGHVLAWGSQSKTAYMAPMEVLFDDIKKTLGAGTVGLPGDGSVAYKSADYASVEAVDTAGSSQTTAVNDWTSEGSSSATAQSAQEAMDQYIATRSPSSAARPLEAALSNMKIDTAQNKLPTPPATTAGTPTGKDIPESFALEDARRSDLQKALKVR